MVGMSNEEVFDLLSDNEERLFYASRYDKNNAAIMAAYEAYKTALVEFSRATGIKNR